MIKFESMPKDIRNKRVVWGNARDIWYENANKEEELFYCDVEGTGTVFTKKQLQSIKDKTGIPLSLNPLYPKISHELAILAKTKPTFKIVSLDERGKQYGEIIDKAIKSVLYNSEATGEEEETIKNALLIGMGISRIEERDYYEYGSFNIEFVNVHPSLIVLDANAKKRNLRDMRGYFYEKEITLEEAKDKYQGLLDAVNQKRFKDGEDQKLTFEDIALAKSFGVIGKAKLIVNEIDYNTIQLTEYYDLKHTTVYYIQDADTGVVKQLFEENLEDDQKFILGGAINNESGRFLRRKLFFGDYFLYEEIKPVRGFDIKVKFFEWGGSPYKCYGIVHFTIGMSQTIDKAIQLMLTNGMLTNNAGYTTPSGGVAEHNKSKWESLGNTPGIMKEFEPVVIDGSVLKPEREQIQQLSNFYPTIIQMARQSIDETTGINAIITGNAQEAKVDVFSSLQQYQSNALERIQLMMSHINLANQQLGNIALDYILANITSEQPYFFHDAKNKIQELQVIKEELKDFQLGKYKLLSVAGEASPSQKIDQAKELFKIAQTSTDPVEKKIFIQTAFELTDSRAFDEVQQKIDVGHTLQNQVQNLSEQLKRIEEINKQLENRVINAEIKAKIATKMGNEVLNNKFDNDKNDT